MGRYVIRTSQYCALCKEIKFQKWLHDNSANLYEKLMNHLKDSTSCKSNTKKMMEIQMDLGKEGKLVDLVKFLLVEYPITIDKDGDIDEKAPEIISTPGPQRSRYLTKIDNDVVFKHYNPHMLTFPQKLVMQNSDLKQLELDAKDFITGKLNTDYIIIDDKAYIEYFKLKYQDESKKIPKDKREIFLYRTKTNIV